MNRIPALDGIRAIAVTLVVLSHGGKGGIIPGGFGVTVFFFLSGYLITSLLRAENAKTGTISLRDFYIRRTLRIMPPLYITLLVCAALVATGLIVQPGRVDPFTVFSQAAFFHNYASLWGDPISLPITGVWSLAVEEHYYLIFPLFYLLMLRKLSRPVQVGICLAMCAVVLGVRFANTRLLADYDVNYLWTHTRIDSILFGAILALANNPAMDERAWRPRGWHAIGALGLIVLTLAIRNPVFRETLRYTLQGAALYALFGYAVSSGGIVARLLGSTPAQIVARYSYTIYLVHAPMLKLIEQRGLLPHWSVLPAAIVLTFAYAAAMYAFVEYPLGRWRHRLHSEPVGELEPPVAPIDKDR